MSEIKARSIEYLGSVMEMHGPSGCCTDCYDRTPASQRTKVGLTDDEWATFLDALRIAARDGEVHQSNVRPIIRGRIAPRHIGSAYFRAIKAGLLTEVRRERSDDVRGRNTNRPEPVYALAGAA